MANSSMNNWLGFSLSPHEQLPLQDHHSQNSLSRLHGFNSDQISGTDVVSSECFDLTSDSTLPSLNLPAPFGLLDTFNRNNLQGLSYYLLTKTLEKLYIYIYVYISVIFALQISPFVLQ